MKVRIRHDREYWINTETGELVVHWRFEDSTVWPHLDPNSSYPAPVPLFAKPAGGGSSKRIPQKWFDYTRSINTPEAWKALRRVNGGWINYAANKNDYEGGARVPDNPDIYPRTESITSIDNVHEGGERKNNATRINAFKYSDDPPALGVMDPLYTCYFRSIDNEGNIGDAPDGIVSYFPLLVDDEAWIPDDKLKYLDEPEEPPMSEKPLWRDYSRHQGIIDFEVVAGNYIMAMVARAAISWGYQDSWFPANWAGAKEIGIYRSSYHVIWTDQPIVKQADNWYKVHDACDVLPRVIDLEVDRGDTNEAKAVAVLAMSDLVLQRDGVRPIIYSRHLLISEWLASWSEKTKNEHYYYLAQYLNDPTKEHPGPPTLPIGVNRDRVLLQQTADKLAGFPGEAQSAAVDYNRWQLGDEAQMHKFIADNWGGEDPTPPPDPVPPAENPELKSALDDMQVVIDTNRQS